VATIQASVLSLLKRIDNSRACIDLCTKTSEIHRLFRFLHLLPQIEASYSHFQLVT
jgi:hypothetical protein